MNEEEILKLLNDNVIACCCGYEYDKAIQGILNLYQKEKEKNEELEEKIKKYRYDNLKLDIKIREIKQVFKEIMEA